MGRQFGNGMESIQAARTETHQAGVMAGGALIPLLDNNSRIHLIPWEMPLFIQFICWL